MVDENDKGDKIVQILLPMAGAGKRFEDAGYTAHKPVIATTSTLDGTKKPMVVCAAEDLPLVSEDGANVLFIDRTFHKQDGVEEEIHKYFPTSKFITVDKLTEGQACTCLLAEEALNPEEALLIAGCDNGMKYDLEKFSELTQSNDFLVFTYRNNECVLENPNAYGWVKVDSEDNVIGVSVKQKLSDTPEKDHAIVATFWLKKAKIFTELAKEMIKENDRIKNEFYVDQIIKYLLLHGYKGKVFEIERYIGWGTPKDYENYENTYQYWQQFCEREAKFFE